jgi:hypothetical protein
MWLGIDDLAGDHHPRALVIGLPALEDLERAILRS